MFVRILMLNWILQRFLCEEYILLKNKHRFMFKSIVTNYLEPCVSACVSSRWTSGQKLVHRQCTEKVSLLCDCRKKIVRSHDKKGTECLSSGLKSIFRWLQSGMLPSNSPSNVLLKIKVFWEDFVTEITLQLGTFSFQMLSCGDIQWMSIYPTIIIIHFLSMITVSSCAVSLINNFADMFYNLSIRVYFKWI